MMRWSLKRLIRRIVLADIYQQSSRYRIDAAEIDPANDLYWRANRQASRFRSDAGCSSWPSVANSIYGRRAFGSDRSIALRGRRTLYAFIDRQNLPAMFRTFDFAIPDTHSPKRPHTVVPQQALFLLNSPFALVAAEQLADRVRDVSGTSVSDSRVVPPGSRPGILQVSGDGRIYRRKTTHANKEQKDKGENRNEQGSAESGQGQAATAIVRRRAGRWRRHAHAIVGLGRRRIGRQLGRSSSLHRAFCPGTRGLLIVAGHKGPLACCRSWLFPMVAEPSLLARSRSEGSLWFCWVIYSPALPSPFRRVKPLQGSASVWCSIELDVCFVL